MGKRKTNFKLKNIDIYKWVICGLAFSLPFDRVPSLEIYGFTLRPSGVFGLAIIILALNKLLKNRLSPGAAALPLSLLLGFGVWSMASLLQVSNTGNTDGAVHVMLPMLFLISVAISVLIVMRRVYLVAVINSLLLGAAVAVAFGFYQFFGNWAGLPNWATGIRDEYSWQRFGFPRMQSTALEPLYFGAFLLLPIALMSMLSIKNKLYSLTTRHYLLLLACFLAVFLTLSRGALMATAIVLGLSAIFHLKQRGRRVLKAACMVFTGMLVTFLIAAVTINLVGRSGNREDLTYNQRGAGTFLSHLTNFRFNATQENLDKNDSIGVRQKARNTAVETLDNKRVLVFGVGPGQYEAYISQNVSPLAAGLPNNLTLELILQFGLLGMLLFYSFIGWLVVRLIRFKSSIGEQCLAKGLAIYFIALLAQAQVFSGFSLTHLWFAVGLGLFLLKWQGINHEQKPAQVSKKIRTN